MLRFLQNTPAILPDITLFRHAVTDNGKHLYPDQKIPVNIANHNVTAEIKDM